MTDSVNTAQESPDTEQPWADLGLKARRVRKHQGDFGPAPDK